MNASSYATQLAKSISRTMACSLQKHPPQPSTASSTTSAPLAMATCASLAKQPTPSSSNSNSASHRHKTGGPRGSLHEMPPLEFNWPPMPVSSHTTHLHLTMMNEDPKDLHTARLIIEELRAKVRYQTEHIIKWRKAYAIQIQHHYRYQKEKTDQMNSLTSQLLLLEARLKRKQKQIASLINHRELTIHRQQKIIDTLSSRLLDHGLEAIDASCTAELDSLNDSDSAVVLEDIDSDCTTALSLRRKSSGGVGCGSDGVTIVRSISDAIETQLNKYGGGARRNNCFLRRPEILETVYSVEEDPEPAPDVAEKRDKFKNRSEKALSSSSTEGQIDNVAASTGSVEHKKPTEKTEPPTAAAATPTRIQIIAPNDEHICSIVTDASVTATSTAGQHQLTSPPRRIPLNAYTIKVSPAPTPATSCSPPTSSTSQCSPPATAISENKPSQQVTNYNRVMSNHRSVTKPKDVKYKRINKAKSKSLEELRGRLKNLVERGSALDPGMGGAFAANSLPQTAQSYA